MGGTTDTVTPAADASPLDVGTIPTDQVAALVELQLAAALSAWRASRDVRTTITLLGRALNLIGRRGDLE